jgi:hypothetical protein
MHRIAAILVALLGGCFGGAHGQYPELSHRTLSPLQVKTPLQYDHIDGPTQAKFLPFTHLFLLSCCFSDTMQVEGSSSMQR